MKRLIHAVFAVAITCLFQTNAYAGRMVFGDKESIRFIANTTLTSPSGERLFLGRRVLTHNFILPYSSEDEGYVFGVSGESSKYYPLPSGEKLSQIQSLGYLPNPLPQYEEDWLDFTLNHFLWFSLLGIGGSAAIKKMRGVR